MLTSLPILDLLPPFFSRLDAVGWFLLFFLITLMVATVAVAGGRIWLYLSQYRLAVPFRQAFTNLEHASELASLVATTQAARHPFGRIAHTAFHTWQRCSVTSPAHRAERLYRALQTQLEREIADREWGLTLLATAANTAPYIGLFGTVWSIYHALTAIATQGEASLTAVAGPVGEALIMTAIGLAVAIPAAIAHNLFARRNRLVIPELEAFAHECYLLLTAEDEERRSPTP